jgi:hypothetical protein
MGNFHSLSRKDFKEINKIDDIHGAQSSTLKKGVQTKRATNPLDPNYVLPGSSELGSTNANNPYAL